MYKGIKREDLGAIARLKMLSPWPCKLKGIMGEKNFVPEMAVGRRILQRRNTRAAVDP